MKVRTHYNRIERVVYQFDANDIRNALLEMAKVRYQPGRRIEFEIIDDTATLTVIHEEPLEVEGSDANQGQD